MAASDFGITGNKGDQSLSREDTRILFPEPPRRTENQPALGVYKYESQSLTQANELISVDMGQIALETAVV